MITLEIPFDPAQQPSLRLIERIVLEVLEASDPDLLDWSVNVNFKNHNTLIIGIMAVN
jgi:hypothetical protein